MVTAELAALYSGRPVSTIRRWAAEGRIKRYGSGRGNVRYNVFELPRKTVDEWTGEVHLGEAPPLPAGAKRAA
jgi:hypothetical protein